MRSGWHTLPALPEETETAGGGLEHCHLACLYCVNGSTYHELIPIKVGVSACPGCQSQIHLSRDAYGRSWAMVCWYGGRK